MYRKSKGRFVGYIHEQVQSIDDINEGVTPSLIFTDFHVLNFGELHEGIRREKALNRNLDLLEVDAKVNVNERIKKGLEPRKMTIILMMRDFINRMTYSKEKFGTYRTRDTLELALPSIKELYNKFFLKETDEFWSNLSKKFLYMAMDMAGEGQWVDIKVGDNEYKRFVSNDKQERVKRLIDRF